MAPTNDRMDLGSVGVHPLKRADEASELLDVVKQLVADFIRAADTDATSKSSGHGLQTPGSGPRTTLLECHPPQKLQQLLDFSLPDQAGGRAALVDAAHRILQYSVNTWDQGFMDKLYASTTPVGLAADLLLSALNTNLHVYQVSPALTTVEKATTAALAKRFGFAGAFAGGVSMPGGSAANQASVVIARNNLFPETKEDGNGARRFVLFTSAHGHYSLEKAAQMAGFGSRAVRAVEVDEQGRMSVDGLEAAVRRAQQAGETPLYVNATAGTTVLGSFDPLPAIADVCQRHGLWMHVDGSWGGPVVFSAQHAHKLRGVERADSLSLCPHKMLAVPLTCSFLLGNDLRQFHRGMTLPAGYLFHASGNGTSEPQDFWDLADLTPQCGRRGDSLKLALSWTYYGAEGFRDAVDGAFETAAHLASLVASHAVLSLLSSNPPPCLQVCFYYRPQEGPGAAEKNSKMTTEVAKALIPRGFMVDYAPGAQGKFFRIVVNTQTRRETVEGLVKAIDEVGAGITV